MNKTFLGMLVGTLISYSGCHCDSLEELAECLVEEGATLYGMKGCSFCENQLELFDSGRKIIEEKVYVDCAVKKNRAECIKNKVFTVPSWKFSGSEELIQGIIPLEQFSKYTSCEFD